MREQGVQIAIDDFGTGFSSLSYLRKFPIDALKIDQSFVSQVASAGDENSIVAAVISMARSLNLRVVARGSRRWISSGSYRPTTAMKHRGTTSAGRLSLKSSLIY